MRRPLSLPLATLRGVRCDCGLPATTQVKVVQLCYTGHYTEGICFVQWMPLCEACAALHATVEAGTTGRALAAAIEVHAKEVGVRA